MAERDEWDEILNPRAQSMPDDAILAFVIRKYREFLPRDGTHSALANALGATLEKFQVRSLAALQLVAGAVDAVDGFPEPERIDAIAADVWRELGDGGDDGGDDKETPVAVRRAPAPDRTTRRDSKPKTRRRKLHLKTWGGIPLVVLDDGHLSKTDIRAFGYVASHIATNGSKQYSYGALAERLGVTRREAIRSVATLTDRRYLLVKQKGTGRRGNVYGFGPDALADGEAE